MDYKNILVDNTQISRDIKKNFLNMHYKPLVHTAESSYDMHYIYVIENLTSGKKYVGRTKNIYARACDYTKYARYPNDFVNKKLRSIAQAIYSEGIENFVMYPIATYNGDYEAAIMEMEFAHNLDSFEPNGYNIWKHEKMIKRNKVRSTYNHTIATKIKKSKLVICINPDTKVMYLSVGMKLFGDLTGYGKDIVKNSAKKPSRLTGFYIIYINKEDRDDMLYRYTERFNKEYERGRIVKPTNAFLLRYTLYRSLVTLVDEFSKSPSKDIFKDYDQYFLNYNENPESDTTYSIEDLDVFLNMMEPGQDIS